MVCLKLSSKNQIVLPKEAREAMKVKGGDELRNHVQTISGKGRALYPKTCLKKERKSW